MRNLAEPQCNIRLIEVILIAARSAVIVQRSGVLAADAMCQ
ncbi:MAG: hypothetical protein U0892_21805 [Pirellulales bacterium]